MCVANILLESLFVWAFYRDDAKEVERVLVSSLSIVLFHVPRKMYMFIAIICMQYIKSKGHVGKCYGNVLRMGLDESSL